MAVQAGLIFFKPFVPMLRESAARLGFFEAEQIGSVLAHLPAEIQPVIEFAAITGWRIASEVLPLEWRQVDFEEGEVRLDAGTTKNGEGRSFPMTADLRTLLTEQKAAHDKLKLVGHISPLVFPRMVADAGATSRRSGSSPSRRSGGAPARRPDALAESRTIFVGRPCATSCAPASRSAWRCR
jgi:integrase